MSKVVNVEIKVGRRDSIEACIRRFTKKVKKSGVLDDYIKHMRIPAKTKRRKTS
tara:strand:+ start:14878 stop:15039 length:162 start_codon:yes stop_codon:yes gene_type:complete